MKICDILSQELIVPDIAATDKEGVLREISTYICRSNHGLNGCTEQVFHALTSRERLGSTGVGEGVAIPHAKIPGLQSLVAAFGRARSGIAFDSIDQLPVRLVFVLLVPENSAGAHLKALARISRLLKDPNFRERLSNEQDRQELFQAFVEEDAKH